MHINYIYIQVILENARLTVTLCMEKINNYTYLYS